MGRSTATFTRDDREAPVGRPAPTPGAQLRHVTRRQTWAALAALVVAVLALAGALRGG